MKGKYITVICLSVVFFLVFAFFAEKEAAWHKQDFLSAVVVSDGREEKVRLWEKSPEEYYLFLPGYADLSQVRFSKQTSKAVHLNGASVTEAMDCSTLPTNQLMELVYDPYSSYQWHALTIFQSADLPTLYIDVKSGDMEYIHEEKGAEESGILRLYSPQGKLENEVVVESMQGRGNSTWLWSEKKPYSLRLQNETDLLGMGEAQRWVLLANSFDPSLLKNQIAYDLARNAGMPYTPECQPVDLYLNGEYAGVYLLSERNEIHPERVDLPADESFLVSWEGEERLIAQGYPYIKTENGTAMRIHWSAVPPEELQRMWQSVENAILASDGIDPVTGRHWRSLIDLDSWAMLFLIDEITADHDGGSISKFFYYDESNGTGKIYAGPVWDKDDVFSTGHWTVTPPNCIAASRSMLFEGKERALFAALSRKSVFSSRVTELYARIFVPLLEDLYETGIGDYTDRISHAALLNEKRWYTANAAEASQVIRDFLGARMDFLEDYWIRKEKFCNVALYDPEDGSRGEFAVRPGECLPEVPQREGYSWFVTGTDTTFDVTQPISESLSLELKPLNPEPVQEVAEEKDADISVEIGLSAAVLFGLLMLWITDLRENGRPGRN